MAVARGERVPLASERPTLTAPEVARMLGMSRDATYVAMREGLIPSVKLTPHRVAVPTAKLRDMLGLPND